MMMTLPTSLTTLTIIDFPNIVFLSSKGFQNLSALQDLVICNCPKLKFLLEKGLPPSLLDLYIYNCPLLKQHARKAKGESGSRSPTSLALRLMTGPYMRWRRSNNTVKQRGKSRQVYIFTPCRYNIYKLVHPSLYIFIQYDF